MRISKPGTVKHILFFTFLANAFIGYPYTNITLGSVPLNELLLLFALFLIIRDIPTIIREHPILLPILIWSLGYLFLSVPFGFQEYGIWAGRDALHLIEVWWIVIAIYVFKKINIQEELEKVFFIIGILTSFKFISFLLGDSIKGILIIPGVQGDIDLIGSTSGFITIVFILLAAWLIGLYKRVIPLLFSILSIAIFQSRATYIGILSSIITYLFIKRFNAYTSFKVFLGLIVLLLTMYLISFMSFLDEFAKFGIESIAPHNIFLHLLSSLGESSHFESSATGTEQRISWFLLNWNRAIEDINVFLFGQGFGPILTNFSSFNIVREPHNSYLSIFARTGFIGLTLWLFFHFYINTKTFLILIKNNDKFKTCFNTKLVFVSFITMHAMYWFSLVEPGFESPQSAINFYILLGIMVNLTPKISRNMN
jgi:hypothetical protein